MFETSDTLMTVSSLFSTGMGAAGHVLLLIIALTVVRRADERGGWLMAAGFLVDLGLAILWPAANVVVARVAEDSALAYSMVAFALTLVRIGGIVLVAFGMLGVAQACLRARTATPAESR
jgi:hypothetical protein